MEQDPVANATTLVAFATRIVAIWGALTAPFSEGKFHKCLRHPSAAQAAASLARAESPAAPESEVVDAEAMAMSGLG